MGHISVYRRMLVWGICTAMAIIGAAKTALVLFGFSHEAMVNYLLYLSLLVGGFAIIVINETVFSVRKTQLEIDRDKTIKNASGKPFHSPMILVICPNCKSRIPADSKYCPECGEDL